MGLIIISLISNLTQKGLPLMEGRTGSSYFEASLTASSHHTGSLSMSSSSFTVALMAGFGLMFTRVPPGGRGITGGKLWAAISCASVPAGRHRQRRCGPPFTTAVGRYDGPSTKSCLPEATEETDVVDVNSRKH
jgi:hypothetical protein